MTKLTRTSQGLIVVILFVCAVAAIVKRQDRLLSWFRQTTGQREAGSAPPPPNGKTVTVALATWPGHIPLVVGNGGLTTQPGSAAAALGLDLRIVFLEDPASRNAALQARKIDVCWQTVDELPITLGEFKRIGLDTRVFLQMDWSRGGDACVATPEVKSIEDLFGKKSAMMQFSPDHNLFEFMVSNSKLTPEQAARVRADVSFSPDDTTYGRRLFAEGKVDVACVWEPDVSLALAARPGAHRLFSTGDATDLIADVLVARTDFLESPLAAEVARVWFAGVAKAEADREAAANLVYNAVPRFHAEMDYDKTLAAFQWVRWTDLGDNAEFFGIGGQPATFDRTYNTADAVWVNYPEAKIKDRFVPSALREGRLVRTIWEAAGRPSAVRVEEYASDTARTGTPVFTKPISVQFRFNEASLEPRAVAVINSQVLPQVQIARSMFIRVEGNTDSTGSPGVNQKLSRKRAQAIVDYLATRGVPRERLVARGNGAEKPVADNDTPEGRARNRRTDILFIPAMRSGRTNR